MTVSTPSGCPLLKASLLFLIVVSWLFFEQFRSILTKPKDFFNLHATRPTHPFSTSSPSISTASPTIAVQGTDKPSTSPTRLPLSFLPPTTNPSKAISFPQHPTKSILIVENRALNPNIIANLLNHTANDWAFELYIPDNVSITTPIARRLTAVDRPFRFNHEFDILLREIRRNKDLNGLFQACTFWKTVQADIVLVAQMDAVMCPSKYSLDDFLQFPYIGAPWPRGMGKAKDKRLSSKRYGGNGGFSLRHKRVMLQCCDPSVSLDSLETSRRRRNEDLFYMRCLRRLKFGVRLGVAGSFAVETMLTKNSTMPVGMHKPRIAVIAKGLNVSRFTVRKTLCHICPPIGMVMRCPKPREEEFRETCTRFSFGTVENKPTRRVKCLALDECSWKANAGIITSTKPLGLCFNSSEVVQPRMDCEAQNGSNATDVLTQCIALGKCSWRQVHDPNTTDSVNPPGRCVPAF